MGAAHALRVHRRAAPDGRLIQHQYGHVTRLTGRAHLVGGFCCLADAMAVSPTLTRLGPDDPASAGWLATRLTLSRNVSRRRPGCCCCAGPDPPCQPGLRDSVMRVGLPVVAFGCAQHGNESI